MEPITVPKLTVSFAVDIDVDYDSFGGKTPQDIAIALQAEIDDLLYEAAPAVSSVYTSITAIDSNDWRPGNQAQYRWCLWYTLD